MNKALGHVALVVGVVSGLLLAAGCGAPAAAPTTAPITEPTATPPAATPAPTVPPARLVLTLLYPGSETELEMGQTVRFIGQAEDARANPVEGAQITVTVRNPAGTVVAELPATADDLGTYRTAAWTVPHRAAEGMWRGEARGAAAGIAGSAQGGFKVRNSASERLLYKYGFWLDVPSIPGSTADLYTEEGDARDGRALLGGARPGGHVMLERWIEVQWRAGNAGLTSGAAVRRFMLEQVGVLGMTPIRDIGPIAPMRFKHWDAWRVEGRGQFGHDLVEWVAFYAPEANRTVLLGTRVVAPPAGIDAHAQLRASFEVVPEVKAAGTAPKPLARLLPGPELVSPPLGARFEGLGQPVVLRWQPARPLGPGEFYGVEVDYNAGETNSLARFVTRETSWPLPADLYRTPNCGVFNWQVTVMRQAGQAAAEPVTYASLYWYVRWDYPAGQTPFNVGCPNEQF